MKHFFAILVAASLLYGCKTSNYTVTGKLDATPGDSLHLLSLYLRDSVLAAGIVAADSSFVLKGRVADAELAVLKVGGELGMVVPDIFLESGELSVAITDGGLVVSGTPLNDSLNLLNAKLKTLHEIYDWLQPGTPEEERTALATQIKRLSSDMVETNKDNLLGIYLLAQYEFPSLAMAPDSAAIASMEVRLDRFPATLQNNLAMCWLRKNLSAVGNALIGKHYLDLSLIDAAGNTISLSSLVRQGRWVLLDFWATWCRPCIAEIPCMREAYRDFHSKGFVIYGVSLDNNPENWNTFVAENDMPWINVLGVGADKQSVPAELYGVRSIPSNFLISPEGIIVAKNLWGKGLKAELVKQIR